MRKIQFFLFFLIVSCSIKVEKEDLEKDPVEVDVEINADLLSIKQVSADVFFYNTYKANGFIGIANNKEIDIKLKLDTKFNFEDTDYGYTCNIEKVVVLNDQYDLLKGNVTKFLRQQNIVRNDTIFKISGFNKRTEGKFLLFNKKTFAFIELEKGFDIYNLHNLPQQLLGDKLYYINSISDLDYVKYIDLKDPLLKPEIYFSSDYITKFLFNSHGDFFYGGSAASSNKYVNFKTGNSLFVSGLNNGLISHFVGLDGEFYAQSFAGNLEQYRLGFYKIEVQSDKLITTNLLEYYNYQVPNTQPFLGNADIVMPNLKRNSSTIISYNTGIGSMYFYEFSYADNKIYPFDVPIVSLTDVGYYNNTFFYFTELTNNGNTNLVKVAFDNYNITVKKSLGYLGKEVLLNKKNGDIYFLELGNNNKTKLSKLNSNNVISSFEFSVDFGSCFSILN